MAKTVKIVIGGREYSLRGENEDLIKKTADELNRHIDDLEKKYKDESALTITTLAALNLAEDSTKAIDKQEINQNFVINEINKMSEFLKSRIDI